MIGKINVMDKIWVLNGNTYYTVRFLNNVNDFIVLFSLSMFLKKIAEFVVDSQVYIKV